MTKCESCSYAIVEDGVYTCPHKECLMEQKKNRTLRGKVESVLKKLISKFKAKEHVTRDEYEKHLQEDIKNKNLIIDDALWVIKAFAKQEGQDAQVLDRSRTMGRTIGQVPSPGGYPQRPNSTQQFNNNQNRTRPNLADTSFKALIDMVKSQ